MSVRSVVEGPSGQRRERRSGKKTGSSPASIIIQIAPGKIVVIDTYEIKVIAVWVLGCFEDSKGKQRRRIYHIIFSEYQQGIAI